MECGNLQASPTQGGPLPCCAAYMKFVQKLTCIMESEHRLSWWTYAKHPIVSNCLPTKFALCDVNLPAPLPVPSVKSKSCASTARTSGTNSFPMKRFATCTSVSFDAKSCTKSSCPVNAAEGTAGFAPRVSSVTPDGKFTEEAASATALPLSTKTILFSATENTAPRLIHTPIPKPVSVWFSSTPNARRKTVLVEIMPITTRSGAGDVPSIATVDSWLERRRCAPSSASDSIGRHHTNKDRSEPVNSSASNGACKNAPPSTCTTWPSRTSHSSEAGFNDDPGGQTIQSADWERKKPAAQTSQRLPRYPLRQSEPQLSISSALVGRNIACSGLKHASHSAVLLSALYVPVPHGAHRSPPCPAGHSYGQTSSARAVDSRKSLLLGFEQTLQLELPPCALYSPVPHAMQPAPA
eukprot:2234875-Rhodomonas_salina.1